MAGGLQRKGKPGNLIKLGNPEHRQGRGATLSSPFVPLPLAREEVEDAPSLESDLEKFAFESDRHQTFIGHFEREGRKISLDNIERLARTLGVPVHVLLTPPAD